ncbi:MAG: ParA family protein [Bdellovibrionia bacterium]
MSNKNTKYILTPTELAGAIGKTNAWVSKVFKEIDTVSLPGRRVGLPPDSVRAYLNEKEGVDYSFKVISHLNLRGGIGKTTASTTLATRAAQYGHKVALLDLDSQGSASLNFNIIPGHEDPVFIDIWPSPKTVNDALVKVDTNLYVLPSSLDNGLLDSSLSKPADQKTAVQSVCKELKKLGFTLVIIDCPPSLGSAIVSTICASDTIVVPVGSDIFSTRGLKLTFDEIHSVCETFNVPIPDIKILFSRYDGREKLSLTTLSEIARDPAYSKSLLPCFIRTSSELPKVTKNKETVFATMKRTTAREDYDTYSRYVLGFSNLADKSEVTVR